MLLILIAASFLLGATAHDDWISQLLPSTEKNPVSGLSLDEATVVMKYHNPQSFLNPSKIMNDAYTPAGFNYLFKILNSQTQASNSARNPNHNTGVMVYAKESESETAPTDVISNFLNSLSSAPNHVFKREASPSSMKTRQKRSPLTYIPLMTSSGFPFFMQSINPALMQNPSPTASQSSNPGAMQSANPKQATMQSVNPAMMQGMNPMLMQSMNPMLMQSPNPLASPNPAIFFVPMMMGPGPTKMGKREAPNSEMVERSKRSPLTYQLVPMTMGMQSTSPMSLPSPNFGYMQSPNPRAMQPSGMVYMVPMASPMGIAKREAPNEEMRGREKRSPLTYQLVDMPLGLQSANPMALPSTNFGYMQSAMPRDMVYMTPMTSYNGMGKREAPNPDMPSRRKRSPLSVSPVLMTSPNMAPYPTMGSAAPMFLVNSAPLMMSSPLLGQPVSMPLRFKREAPRQKRSPLSVSPILMMNPMESLNPMILQSTAPLMVPSPILTQPMAMPMGFGKREAPNPDMPSRQKRSH